MAIELRDADVKILSRKKKKQWFEVSLAMHKNQRHVVKKRFYLTIIMIELMSIFSMIIKHFMS